MKESRLAQANNLMRDETARLREPPPAHPFLPQCQRPKRTRPRQRYLPGPGGGLIRPGTGPVNNARNCKKRRRERLFPALDARREGPISRARSGAPLSGPVAGPRSAGPENYRARRNRSGRPVAGPRSAGPENIVCRKSLTWFKNFRRIYLKF
jgi:hypothetical protein